MDHDPTPDLPFDPLFDPLRGALNDLNTPRGVEKELMQAFARRFPRKHRWYETALHRLATPAWAIGASLAAALVAVLLFAGIARQPYGGVGAGGRPLLAYDAGGLFIALDSLDRIAREPHPRVVATEIARTTLAPLGVPLTPENAGEPVRAEMLVGADGRPLALRLSTVQ